MLKLKENPPIISPLTEDVSSLGKMGNWFVAHTLSRFEKVFVADMLRKNVGYFFPLAKRITYSSGRKRVSQIPLFPGYVFLCGDQESRQLALRTNRLCQVLEVSDSTELENQLTQIHRMLQSGQDVYSQAILALGDRCRVTAGPLEGLEGVICRTGSADRLVVNINMLGRGAAVEIDSTLLEKI